MAQRIDWTADHHAAERVLQEIWVDTKGTASYREMWSLLSLKGYEAESPDAIRNKCYLMGFGTRAKRVEYAANARREIQLLKERPDLLDYFTDKKESEIDLDEIFDLLERMQEVSHRASPFQTELNNGFSHATGPVAVCQISDWHIASYGTDHRYARRFLDELELLPDLYLAIVGDMENMQINLDQGVAASQDNMLRAPLQTRMLDMWLSRVASRTLVSTWDNHSVERQEKGIGQSPCAEIFASKVPMFDGIGHWNFTVGDQVYRLAVSHKMRGRSVNNPCIAGMKYMRHEAQDREIVMCGDSHEPGLLRYNEGGMHRIALNSGTLQAGGYSQRYYSLIADKVFPVVVFHPDHHVAVPYWSVKEWLVSTGRYADLERMRDLESLAA